MQSTTHPRPNPKLLRHFPNGLRWPVSALCARWAGTLEDGKSTTFSPAGAWPVLAILAAGAAEDVRPPLEETLGMSADKALPLAGRLITWLSGVSEDIVREDGEEGGDGEGERKRRRVEPEHGVAAALGLWVTDDINVKDAFRESLPPGTLERLRGSAADAARLNSWANSHTQGLIPSFPIEVPRGAQRGLLASAISLKTEWQQTFSEHNGVLHRTTEGARIIRASPEVTLVCIGAKDDIDIHLVLGKEGASPAEVIPLGLNALSFRPLKNDKNNPDGLDAPGLRTEMRTEKKKGRPMPKVHLRLPPFDITAEHDLINCGLGIPPLKDTNDFPNISDDPLGIESAVQFAKTKFDKEGFKAAAVTAGIFAPSAARRPRAPPPKHEVLHITVQFDRPFGFLATDAVSRAVLFAGWVADGFYVEW